MVKTELLLITFFSDKMIKEKLIIITREASASLSRESLECSSVLSTGKERPLRTARRR
jgi:hypothetical protein